VKLLTGSRLRGGVRWTGCLSVGCWPIHYLLDQYFGRHDHTTWPRPVKFHGQKPPSPSPTDVCVTSSLLALIFFSLVFARAASLWVVGHRASSRSHPDLGGAYVYKKLNCSWDARQHQFNFIRRLSWSIYSNFSENSLFECASQLEIAKNSLKPPILDFKVIQCHRC